MTILTLIEKYDRDVNRLEAVERRRVNTALDAAYRSLERDLRKNYPKLQTQGSLTVVQRQLLILNELQTQLVLLPEAEQEDYEERLHKTLETANENGRTLADELITARAPNHRLQDFAAVPTEAIAAQAKEGTRRLYRHSADFASKASAIVEQGLVQGWGAGRVSRILRDQLKTTKTKAETIAITEINAAYATAANERYKRNRIEYVQWAITPSENVCVFCSARNGNVYLIDKVKLPVHPRDKCVLLPYRIQWAQAGLTEEPFFENYRERGLKELNDRGLTPEYNKPAPFEKESGLTAAPTPFWIPGQPIPTVS